MQEFLSSPSASSLSLRPSSTLVHVRHTLVCINKRISSLSEIRRKGEWLVFRGIRRNYVREWCADSRKLTKKKWKLERSILLPFPGPRLAKQSLGKLYFHRLDGRPVHASIEYFFLSLRISSFFYFPFEMRDDSFVYIRCFNKF